MHRQGSRRAPKTLTSTHGEASMFPWRAPAAQRGCRETAAQVVEARALRKMEPNPAEMPGSEGFLTHIEPPADFKQLGWRSAVGYLGIMSTCWHDPDAIRSLTKSHCLYRSRGLPLVNSKQNMQHIINQTQPPQSGLNQDVAAQGPKQSLTSIIPVKLDWTVTPYRR